jgi:hypothetical protein
MLNRFINACTKPFIVLACFASFALSWTLLFLLAMYFREYFVGSGLL